MAMNANGCLKQKCQYINTGTCYAQDATLHRILVKCSYALKRASEPYTAADAGSRNEQYGTIVTVGGYGISVRCTGWIRSHICLDNHPRKSRRYQ